MNKDQRQTSEKQQKLLQQWVDSLQQLPAVEVIWIEGSLVDDRANPWSDIDLRVGLTDAAYAQLWETDRRPLLEGLGEYLLIWELGFVRAITAEGIVVELLARRSSELEGLALYEWKFLFNRLPGGPPRYEKLPERSLAETWPGRPVSAEDVRKRTLFVLYVMAIAPPDFYRGEVCATALTLDLLRSQLFETLYQRLGIQIAKRSKELSRVFPPEFLEDFAGTYTQEGESALDPAAIAAAQIRTFAALGKHLQALSGQAGGGFEPEWFERLFERTSEDLSQLAGAQM